MVNYYIYARDCSFSTFKNEHYHINGLKTLEQFKRDVENIKEEQLAAGEPPMESKVVYLHWGDDCWEVSEDETRTAYLEQNCEQMGTDPKWIIQLLKKKYIVDDNDKIKLLYIITDGLISYESVNNCFRLNDFMDYEIVVFHAFNENPEKIDLSVAASFLKRRCIVYRNYKLYISTDISKEFGYDRISVNNFVAKKDQLKSYIALKFINGYERDSIALEVIYKLKNLRDRLLDELSLETLNFEKIIVNLATKDKGIFRRKFVGRDLDHSSVLVVSMMKSYIEKSILALINYIFNEAKSYSFDSLTLDTEFDESVEEELIDDVDLTSEEEFEIFDFVLEDDIGVPYVNRLIVDVL